MPYAIKFTDPAGVVSYMPEGFGHSCHAHVPDVASAWKLDGEAQAQRILNGYVNPPAFWNSERAHAEKMRAKFRNWKCEIINTAS